MVSILLLCGASESLLQPSASIEEICRTKVNTQRRQSYLKGLHGISTSLTAIAYDIGRHGLPQVKNIVTKRCVSINLFRNFILTIKSLQLDLYGLL